MICAFSERFLDLLTDYQLILGNLTFNYFYIENNDYYDPNHYEYILTYGKIFWGYSFISSKSDTY